MENSEKIKYSVFMDPDVEFMDENGKFPSEYKESSVWKFLFFIIVATIMVILIIVFVNGLSRDVVQLKPTSSSINIIDVGEVEAPTKEENHVRVLEGPLKEKLDDKIKPYFIDSYDYAPYNYGLVGLNTVMNEIGYDSPKLLVSTFYNGIIDVIGSGYYRMHKENGNYIYYLYLPKQETEVFVEGKAYLNEFYDSGKHMYAITLLHGNDVRGEIPLEIHVKYTDGYETFFTVKIEKDYT